MDAHQTTPVANPLKNYRAILFDLDGTLVDSFPAIHQSLVAAMRGTGVTPWDLTTTTRHVGRGIEHLVENAVGSDNKGRALEIFRRDYGQHCLERSFLLPSVSGTLPRLRAAGYRLAVATNKPLSFTRRILEHLGISPLFDCIAGPELVTHLKPHPAMIEFIREELGAEARQCLYAGDMPLDAETAGRAGVDCVLIATGAHTRPELERLVTVPVLDNFSQVAAYLGLPECSASRVRRPPHAPQA